MSARSSIRESVAAVSESVAAIGSSAVDRAVSRRPVASVVGRVVAAQDAVVENVFRPHGVTALYWSFAFVFFYFGFQKPAPVFSPVRVPLAGFFDSFGVPVATGMLFVGTYEMFLGLLLLFRQIRPAFWLFYAHQAVTVLALFVVPRVAFQPPWIAVPVVDVAFPIAVTGFGAFVAKNVVFLAGFTLLASVELGSDAEDGSGTVSETGSDGDGAGVVGGADD